MAVLDLLGLLIIGSVTIAGLGYFRERRREERGLKHTPLVAIERGSEVYKIAQESTRLLEHLVDDPMVACTIPESTKQRMRKSIDDFFRL